MKKLVLFLSFYSIIVFSLLFYSGCKSDTINGPDNISPPPDTLGNVSGYINSIEGPVEDAYITLNGKTTFSDSIGHFEFKDLLKNNSMVTVSHPEFSEYSDSVNITDSLNLNIELTRIKYDYFPLKVGNRWKYYWENVWYASGGGGGSSAGTIDWEIESVSGAFPNFLFKLKETRYDSSDNSSTERYLDLLTNNSDSIEVLGSNYILRVQKMRRYYDTTYSDIAYIFTGYYNYTLKLKKNIGVIQCYYGVQGINFGEITNFEILCYTLN